MRWESPAYLCPIAPFRPDIALEFYGHMTGGDLAAAQQIVFQYEEPLMRLASRFNWLNLMKTAIMMHGFYPNNRVGNPTKATLVGDELQEAQKFYTDLFDLPAQTG